MKIAISGAGGMIGACLVNSLGQDGHKVLFLVRGPVTGYDQAVHSISYDCDGQTVDSAKLEGLDCLIHLAGESIASGRWDVRKKRAILSSRVNGTHVLARALAQLRQPPRLFVVASAVGYYGTTAPAGVVMDEQSSRGSGFLAEVCQAWEDAALPARKAGIRVVHLRFGSVLAASGGMLARLIPLFKSGFGGYLGSGRQILPWIALDELPGIVRFIMCNDCVHGPVNCVAPQIIQHDEFVRILAIALRRKVFVRVPAFVLKAALGEMADALLLSGVAVRPALLESQGYVFRFPTISQAMVQIFRRDAISDADSRVWL